MGSRSLLIVASAGLALAIAGSLAARRHAAAPASAAPDIELGEPPELAGFWSRTSAEQERVVTELAADRHWQPSLRRFVLAAVASRRLTPLARNNLADGLLAQEPPIPDLGERFLRMMDDPAEDAVWRQYAVQFAAVAAADDPRLPERLYAIVAADDPRAGTAALQLQRLAARGVTVPAGFSARLETLAADESRPLGDRVTAIGILGERATGLAVVRRLALDPAAAIRRAAIAAIGRLAESSDRPLLAAATHDVDASVAEAARAALHER